MITIVSGLPRSGTSMCMQMLEAGGLPILGDGGRAPDEDNPRGYYEYESVKNLAEDASWLGQAEGKVIKVVSALLQHLPEEYEYRILFMRRPFREVLASQAAMLARRNEEPGPDDRAMASYFRDHLSKVEEWLTTKPNMKTLDIEYHEVLNHPAQEAARMAGFLDLSLKVDAMADAVERALHRHR